MEITASVMTAPNEPLETVTLELSDPRPDEVLVRLAATGICASDAHTHTGRIPSPSPCVLGHEGAGVVERVGANVTHVGVGDHVALSWVPSCGVCRHCVSGRPVLCTAAAPALLAGTLLDGTVRLHRDGRPVSHYSFLSTFATHAVVPAASAVRIGRDVPLAVASLVGCGILTGYGAVVNKAKVTPGSSVLVFGAGGVGLSAVMAARVSGAGQIIVVDPVESKLEEATVFGATAGLVPSDDLVSRIRDLSGGGVDYAIDAAGGEGILGQAFAATIPGGTIVCVGMPDVDARPSLPGPELVRDEKIVTGSLYGSSRPSLDIPSILRQYAAGVLPLDRMITQAYDLDRIDHAFADMRAGKLKRGVVVFDEQLAGLPAPDPVVTLAA
ncbi:alcohol dehydrogenase/S-(hydroxymethyl)glutathione dehydrogenase/alcohol dehydrogenase [Actinomycetospora succinea]|uniref:Alcohol dehydrogenase/S-(Hydroxymethyl)glutathione dehydrogenase/alcohol dehydrogenase n=2 Tax=Actinomycetospora succinea TaxID=663603 RepID=A0A4R6UXY5_9PSEU|nr:alcohol dehydrogenase/S-(hydroxymethyl)glutathione dehydrogenase/alcohol dehydrogenase [Actinomycetospora succinea]